MISVFSVVRSGPGELRAAEPPKDLDAQVRRLGQQVTEIAGKQQGLLDRLELLKRRVRLSEGMVEQVRARREAHAAAVLTGEARLRSLRAESAATRGYLLSRMRQCYALGLLQEYRLYFAAGSTQNLRESAILLSALAQRDKEALRLYESTIREQEELTVTLASEQASLDRAEAEIQKERQSLVQQQGQLAETLALVTREKESSQKVLKETLAAARTMDQYMKDLSFKKQVDLYTKDMAAEKGRLPHPVSGRVVQRFGDYIHPKYKTKLPHPGLDFQAPLGAPVTAVFDGTVVYAGWLSGYGYTVILAHPGGFFSVYGHLDEVRSATGAVVPQGEAVGTAGGDVNRGAPGIYFELRAGDRAVDPTPWLKGR